MRTIAAAETGNTQSPGSAAETLLRVAVAGATGYAGRELLRLLARHPHARVTRLMSSGRRAKEGFPIGRSHPFCAESSTPFAEPLSLDGLVPGEVDLVFLATPHETAMEVAPARW